MIKAVDLSARDRSCFRACRIAHRAWRNWGQPARPLPFRERPTGSHRLEPTHDLQGRTDEIAAASEEQSTTSEEIARSVESISTAARESAAGVTEVSDTASRLKTLSEELEKTVQQFNIGRSDGGNQAPAPPSDGRPAAPSANDGGGSGQALGRHNFGDGSPSGSSPA